MRQPKRCGESGSEATSFEQELVCAGQAVRMPEAQRQALWSGIASRIPGAGTAPNGDGGVTSPSADGGATATVATAAPAIKVLVVAAVVGGAVGGGLWAMRGHGVADETARRPGIVSTTAATTRAKDEARPGRANEAPRPPMAVLGPRRARVGDTDTLATSGVGFGDAASPAAVGGEAAERAGQGAGTAVRSPAAEPGSRVSDEDAEQLGSRLQEESDALLAAREAYRAGDSARALQLLERARRRFPHGTLGQEREALTIQVLAQSGARGAAKQRAEAFLRRYPRSPHAADVRGVAER